MICSDDCLALSTNLFAKAERAENEECDRHDDQDREMRPVFEKMCAAQNDGAHERNEIGRGKKRAECIKDPWHGFARKNESGKENAR